MWKNSGFVQKGETLGFALIWGRKRTFKRTSKYVTSRVGSRSFPGGGEHAIYSVISTRRPRGTPGGGEHETNPNPNPNTKFIA